MLIGAFQVQVCGPVQTLPLTQHAFVGHTGIKPDVEGVGDFVVVVGFITQQLAGIQIKPGIDALGFHAHRYLLHQRLGVRVGFARNLVNE